MQRIMIAGIGTDVGKTIVSGIIATLLGGEYWKPVQCGDVTDSTTIQQWGIPVHPPAYTLKAPLSPHHAARLEHISIDPGAITPPKTTRPLIIEGVVGILVPLTPKVLSIDLFKSWDCKWIIVSRHYVGSINHTLLTISVLKQLDIPLLGIVFNGAPNPDSETAILERVPLPILGRLLPELHVNKKTIQRYAKRWKTIP